MRTIKYSIQYPNFDGKDFGDTTFAKLENKLINFDWSKYLAEGEKLQETTGDSCPASFHLTDSENLFSLANISANEFSVFASIPKEQKKFYFLKLGSSSKTVEHFPLSLEDSLELLKAYFNAEFGIIENHK